MGIFEEKYSKLNIRQKEAVDTIEGPVMVIAGPGTGKTTILTLRIANILKTTDTPPSGILAITYTDAGVKAMRLKLREVIGSRADEVRIHTFHGFAASLLAEFDEYFPHLRKARQMSDIDADELVRSILKDDAYAKLRPLGDPEFYVQKIVRSISDAKREALTPGMLRSFLKEEIVRIQNDESSISTRGATKGKLKAEALDRIEKCERTLLFADVYELYERKKREEDMMDFDDLIIELLVALKNNELFLRLVQEKFLYILVDEHQDTNDSQNLLIRSIADFFDNPNLFVVGDEKQAIYRFQGASVENFLTFQNVWKSMKLISLDMNYRSHQTILDAGFSLIENNYGENEYENLRIKLSSGAKHNEKPVDVVTAGNSIAADEYLTKELKRISKEEPDSTVAVITRTNRDLERLISLFDAAGVKASAERGADIFSHPVGVLFFELVRFLGDHSEVEALAKTLSGGLWRLSFSESVPLIKSIKSGDLKALEVKIPALRELFRDISRKGSLEYLVEAAELSGFIDIVAKDPLSAEVWRGIMGLSEELSRKSSIEDPKVLIAELLSYQTSAEGKSVKVSTGSPETHIRMMTAHSSKGLEFDYVFMPYAVEESWMPRVRSSYFIMPGGKSEGDEIKDSRRLFYVGLTRAKKHAVILSPLEDGPRKLSPLRFIDELGEHVSKISIPTASAAFEKKKESLSSRRQQELIDYAKSIILEKGLSVTALNHFCKCPSHFFYKSILKLPEPPSASAEKGNAMHLAISRVWALEDRGEKQMRTTIESTLEEYFEKSLLPAFEKKAVLKELLEDAKDVSKALVPHFAQPGEASPEIWMETSVDVSYEGKPVSVRLHGKLDAVVLGADKVSVFDYKTRTAMSPAAIKGETKGSTGDYFRQLIFYKLLIQSNSLYKGKVIEPSLVFVKPDDKGRCPTITLPVEQVDVERVKGEVKSLIESVWSGALIKDVCEDDACEWCRWKKTTGWRE